MKEIGRCSWVAGARLRIWIAGDGIHGVRFRGGVGLGFKWREVGFAVAVGWISRVVGLQLSDIWIADLAGRRRWGANWHRGANQW